MRTKRVTLFEAIFSGNTARKLVIATSLKDAIGISESIKGRATLIGVSKRNWGGTAYMRAGR